MKHLQLKCMFLLSILSAGVSAQQVHSWWANTPVTVDGSPAEWPQPFRYYDGNTKLQFSVANDTANIYVCIKVTDEPTESRLFKSGLNIWIDPKGKRKENTGIVFPIKAERNPGEGESHHYAGGDEMDPRVQHNNISRLKEHAFMDQTTLRIKGFKDLPEQTLPLKNDYGIDVAFDWDTFDILTIEYKIPIVLALGHRLSATDTIKPIGIGFVESSAESGQKSENAETGVNESGNSSGMGRGMDGGGMGGMGGGGMGSEGMGGGMGGRGGGMGGGGRGGGMNSSNFNSSSQEQKVWSKVKLAWQ
jgi:hypothetical protein